jgi:RND family efflux transporter MFP subunit
MKETIHSKKHFTAAKAAWFQRLVRTAKAVRFHGGPEGSVEAVRFQDDRDHVVEAVRSHNNTNVILSRGPEYKIRSERRTYAFPQHSAVFFASWHQGSLFASAVEAQGFSPAKKLPFKRGALALVGVFAILLALVACSSEPRTVSAAPESVRDVQLLTAQRVTVPDWLEAVGTLQAAQTSQLASQIMGNVVEMRVKEGDRIKRGEVLAVLEDAQPQAGVQRAMAAENAAQQEIAAADSDNSLAEATFKRYQDLYNKKSVSPQEFDEIKARRQAAAARSQLAQAGLAQAQAALAQAQTTFGYTRLRAPFDGVVTEKRADPGTLASPGMPLLVVEDQRRFRLEASVDEGDIHLIQLGQTVPVTLDSVPGKQFSGHVAQILPAADPASRSFVVKIELRADAQLRSGLFGRAHIIRGERQAILLPRSALLDRGQVQAIFVLGHDRVATLRYVTVGKAQDEQVEVLSGLQGGERVVSAPGDRELGGKRVEGN